MIGSVMAAVIAVVAFGEGSVATAGMLGAVAMISFAASLVLFAFDSRRSEGRPAAVPELDEGRLRNGSRVVALS